MLTCRPEASSLVEDEDVAAPAFVRGNGSRQADWASTDDEKLRAEGAWG